MLKREKSKRMRHLVDVLNRASNIYYNQNREVMSNKEFDSLYDELLSLEEEIGVTLSNSPTQKVGYEISEYLPKEKHEHPAKSLGKTKNVEDLKSFLKKGDGILSWKLDGLTVILTYIDGKLDRAVTRGNGEYGENITSNARTFSGVPDTIPYKDKLVIRGEAVISYEKFNEINETLPEDEQYANPRNLASGSVRQLDSSIAAQRGVDFIAFEVVDGFNNMYHKSEKLDALAGVGFEVVGGLRISCRGLYDAVNMFNNKVEEYKYPVDGLVLTYDNIAFSESLGETAKAPLHSIAFKWADDTVETKLIGVEWSVSRTGAINPVAVFEPVELEGTTVERASLHNVDIFESYDLGVGDTITVYKANKIIPQVDDNLTRTGGLVYPYNCPVCGHATDVKKVKVARVLHCTNDNCGAKVVKKIAHFVSRNAMNIDGISESTIEKLVDNGFVKCVTDIYRLDEYKEQICELDGFGEKSYNKMIKSIEKSKLVDMANFVYALGIPNIGLSTAKALVKHFDNDFHKLMTAKVSKLTMVDGVGEVMATDINKFFNSGDNLGVAINLLSFVTFKEQESPVDENSNITGKTFVVTGDVHIFKNRKELQAKIESLGGKVTGSVSKNTDYLINNDSESSSSKNKKARELNIPIINEEEFVELTK